jgi:hypothetical protein
LWWPFKLSAPRVANSFLHHEQLVLMHFLRSLLLWFSQVSMLPRLLLCFHLCREFWDSSSEFSAFFFHDSLEVLAVNLSL